MRVRSKRGVRDCLGVVVVEYDDVRRGCLRRAKARVACREDCIIMYLSCCEWCEIGELICHFAR